MLNLAQCDEKDVAQFARQLLNTNRGEKSSFEKAAQIAVEAIFDEFRGEDGKPLFLLVRIFRFSKLADLSPELRALATAQSEYWLALMASKGVEEAWCDRRKSKGHRAIPADNPMTPMLKAAFQQIGLRFGEDIRGALQTYQQEKMVQARYFHVPVAHGSPYVPEQEGFVVPYNIQSVAGFGSSLSGETSYMCIGFSRDPISQEGAAALSGMNPFVGTLLAFHGIQAIWD